MIYYKDNPSTIACCSDLPPDDRLLIGKWHSVVDCDLKFFQHTWFQLIKIALKMFHLAQILAMRLVIKDMEGIAVGFFLFFLKCSNQIFTSYIKNGFIYFSYVFHWISWIGSINVCTSNNLHWAYKNGKQ